MVIGTPCSGPSSAPAARCASAASARRARSFALLHHHGVEGRVQPVHAGEEVLQRLARTQRAGGDLPGQQM
jgi:hypothetical protein